MFLGVLVALPFRVWFEGGDSLVVDYETRSVLSFEILWFGGWKLDIKRYPYAMLCSAFVLPSL